jgi:hypothetical protein
MRSEAVAMGSEAVAMGSEAASMRSDAPEDQPGLRSTWAPSTAGAPRRLPSPNMRSSTPATDLASMRTRSADRRASPSTCSGPPAGLSEGKPLGTCTERDADDAPQRLPSPNMRSAIHGTDLALMGNALGRPRGLLFPCQAPGARQGLSDDEPRRSRGHPSPSPNRRRPIWHVRCLDADGGQG